MLTLIISVLLVIITYIYMRWVHLKQYWAKRKIPYTEFHPLFGSMRFLQDENPSLWFRRVYDTFKTPYVGIWIFWRTGLLVNSPEIAKNILIKDQANFRNRLVSSGTSDPIGRLNLLTLNDPLWSVLRKQLTVLFTGSKLRGVQNLITQKSKELVERIEKDRQKPDPINLRSVLTDFSTDIIGTSSFGLVSDATLTGKSHMRAITEKFMQFDFIRGLAWCSAFFVPELVDFFRFKVFPTETTEFMREVLRTIIAKRGGFENKVTEPRDLLDILIKLKQQDSEELEMTEDLMLAQAAVFLQAGFDTTALALTFSIYELAFCPTAQEKLFTELQQAKDNCNGEILDASVLSQLTYLNCVINESLRKHTTLSWLDRIAIADYKIDDHLTIKAGTTVFVNIVGIHYDPEFYPEPEKFNPDRFLPENESNIKNFRYLPFGEGPRKCIGQRFALSTVRHSLAAVILNYKIKPLPNSPKPVDVVLAKRGLSVAPEDMLLVEFVPRLQPTAHK